MAASAGDAHPWPIYNARFRVVFPILDADGDLVTGAAGLDSEASQDQGTFADCTNEATELATASGMYYLDLVAGELDTKATALIVKTSTSGAKTTPMVLYPKRLPVLRTGTAQAGAGSTITLDAGASAVDDFYNGCYVNITNNSPSNAQGQARRIIDYVGSTKVATVEAAWGTNPSSASTFEILAPGDTVNLAQWAGTQVTDPLAAGQPAVDVKFISNDAGAADNEEAMFDGTGYAGGTAKLQVDVRQYGGSNGTFASGRPEVNATHWDGTAVASAVILAAANIASNALTAAKFASGAFDAVWSVAARLLTAGTNIVLAKGTGVTGFNDLSAAQVNTEVDTAIADARLDELVAADSDIDGAAPPAVGSVFHELMSKTAGSFTFDQATDSLEAVRDNMGTPQTGDSFARLGAPVGASLAADVAGVKSDSAAIKAKTDNLPEGIKKNTALNNFEFFMTDSADHVTGKTGLTVAGAVSIDGADFAALTNTPATEVANGVYKINLAAADLNGTVLTLKFTASGADATVITLKTTP